MKKPAKTRRNVHRVVNRSTSKKPTKATKTKKATGPKPRPKPKPAHNKKPPVARHKQRGASPSNEPTKVNRRKQRKSSTPKGGKSRGGNFARNLRDLKSGKLKARLARQERELAKLAKQIAKLKRKPRLTRKQRSEEEKAERVWKRLANDDDLAQAVIEAGHRPTDLTEFGEEYYRMIARISGMSPSEAYSELMGSPKVVGVAA